MSIRINLHAEPGVVKSWHEFRSEYPPYSIALDGFVDDVPKYELDGPYANFDHHHGVSRMATRSTSMQVLIAIGLGLFDTFQKNGQPFANVFVNDCDQDVCLSYYLLTNEDKISEIRFGQRLAQLIIFEDFMDTTAGAYPVDISRPILREQAWVFEHYERARMSGRLLQMPGNEVSELIVKTAERIEAYAEGNGKQRELDTNFERLGGGKNWELICETGMFARTRLFSSGIRAFVSVRNSPDGAYHYSVGRMSPFVRFPLAKIFQRLNEIEDLENPANCWGGSDTIGGSPRKTGSRLAPNEIEQIINELIGN